MPEGIVKGPADFFRPGDWNVVCSICGFKGKASEMVKNWQGLWRHPRHNESRQPQDFVRGVADIQAPPWVQPPEDLYVQICTPAGISAIPGYALPGCMIPGRRIAILPSGVVITGTLPPVPGGGYTVPGAPTGVTAK
jgi:hypothetical protein